MISRSTALLTVSVWLLGMAAGCNRFESPRDRWYRQVSGGTLQPIPFSHELDVLGYSGWQFLGKLPGPLARADAVEFSIRVTEEELTEETDDSPAFTMSWQPEESKPHRIDVDLLLIRTFEDGQPVFRYRARVNGSELNEIFAVPEGHRHELTVEPTPDPMAIRAGLPILLGTVTLTSWSRDQGERTAYNLISRTYRWHLQLDPVGPNPPIR